MAKKQKADMPDHNKAKPNTKDKNFSEAHQAADKDIEKDPDLNSKHHRGDDLDEGELARLEGED